MTGIYVDRPSLRALSAVALSGIGRGCALLWFDDSAGVWASGPLKAVGLLGRKGGRVEFQVADVVDADGAAQFYRVWEDGRDLVFRIMDERVSAHPLVRRWADRFDPASIEQLLAKVIDTDLLERVLLVNACEWHAREAGQREPVFFVERDLWTPELAEYARTRGVTLRVYGHLLRPSDRQYLGKFWRMARVLLAGVGRRLSGPRREAPAVDTQAPLQTAVSTAGASRDAKATVASWYTARTITFDRSLRSDLFWLLDSPLDRDRVLLYFDRPDVPAPEHASETLSAQGVRATAFSAAAAGESGVGLWSAGPAYRAKRAELARALMGDVFALALRGRVSAPFYVFNLFYFAEKYAWWLDFFTANSVKVSVSPYDFTKTYMPKNRALRDAGGVAVSYQWSNFDFASLGMAASTDVYASFGPRYREVYRANRSQIATMLYNGYVTDLAFQAAKPRASAEREQLEAAGARYVVAFFDENSSDARSSVISDACAAASYRRLLEWVLADESLGLVLKPGYPRTLRRRIGDVAQLLDRAIATGRCLLMDSGSHVTDRYPAEAALAADLAIGLLLSGTAALEAYLAGTPTVFLDVERLYHMPVYEYGSGTIVFDSAEKLVLAVDAVRRDPEAIPGFGDLSRWAEGRDAHRDGRAAERLGTYVSGLVDAFDSGADRDGAIAAANAAYAREWGEGNVVAWD